MKIKFGTLMAVICLNLAYSFPHKRPLQYPKDQIKRLLDIISECTEESGASKRAWELLKDESYEDSEIFKDFIYCSTVKVGMYTDSGKPMWENLFKIFKDDDVRTVFKQCSESVSGERPKDLVFSYYKCYQENSPVHLLF